MLRSCTRSVRDSIPAEGYRHPSPTCRCSSLTYSQESFSPFAIFGRPPTCPAALLGIGEALLGIGQLLFERRSVEVLGGDRLLDQQPRVVAEDLQPAVRLGVAARLRAVLVEAQLGMTLRAYGAQESDCISRPSATFPRRTTGSPVTEGLLSR